MAKCPVNSKSSNVTNLAIAEEECLKQLPDNPVWQDLEPNSYTDFSASLTTVAREPISQSRQRKKGTPTDLEVSGGFNTDFMQTNLAKMLQGFMFADMRQLPTTSPMNGDKIAVSKAEANTFEVSKLGTLFAVGSIIKASGFQNSQNNGSHVVTASTDTSVEVETTLIDETGTDECTLEVVGYQLASASIVKVGKLVSLEATELTNISAIIPGMWLFLGSDSNSISGNNGFARVGRIEAGKVIFDNMTFDAVAGSGKLDVYLPNVVQNEKTVDLIKRRSYTLERTLGDNGQGGIQAEYIQGAVPNEMTISIPTAEKLSCDMSFVACDSLQVTGKAGDERIAGTHLPAPIEDAFNTSSDVYSMGMTLHDRGNSHPGDLFAYVTEMSISINNNITANKAVGVLGAIDVSEGMFAVGGSVTAYFATVEAVQAVRKNADVGLYSIFASKNAGFLFDIPLLTLGGGSIAVEKDSPITVPLEPSGAENEHGYTLAYQQFQYLPNVAMPQ